MLNVTRAYCHLKLMHHADDTCTDTREAKPALAYLVTSTRSYCRCRLLKAYLILLAVTSAAPIGSGCSRISFQVDQSKLFSPF
jgi:hypothetical protein